MAKFFVTVLAAALVLLLGSTTLPAAVLLSEDFSGATPGLNTPAGPLSGTIMTALGDGVDILGPGVFPSVCTDGGFTGPCVDLNALSPGGLRTTNNFTLSNGVTYRIQVSFWGNSLGTVPVTVDIAFGTAFATTVTINPNANTFVDTTFVGDGSNVQLSFLPNAQGANAGIIDNIIVESLEDEIPEPATWLGLGSGLVLLGLMKLRRA